MMALYWDAIRLASVLAGALVFVTWLISEPSDMFRVRWFRRAWAMLGFALVVGLTPGLAVRSTGYGLDHLVPLMIAVTLAYCALTTAAAAQSGDFKKSLLGSSLILIMSFCVAGF
jgi:hypothetical protein